ncbi:hypothetical protein ACEPAG_8225 [Sanghuangporus baumii]
MVKFKFDRSYIYEYWRSSIIRNIYRGSAVASLLNREALDTTKYFVVAFALSSNGEFSSPSNTPKLYNGPYFSSVSYPDNV